MTIENDCAVIETSEEAACFYEDFLLDFIEGFGPAPSKESLLEAIIPKKGDAVFWWIDRDKEYGNDDDPQYSVYGVIFLHEDGVSIKANALTIGKNVGELRTLLKWATLS